MSEQRSSFRRFDECTKENISVIGKSSKAFAKGLPDRVLEHLKLLDGDFGGLLSARCQDILDLLQKLNILNTILKMTLVF